MLRSSAVFRTYWKDELLSMHPVSDSVHPVPVSATNGQWSDRLMSRDRRLADDTVIAVVICVTSAEMWRLQDVLTRMQVKLLVELLCE